MTGDGGEDPAAGATLRGVLTGSAIPYGYTLSVWSTGELIMHRHGPPAPGEVAALLAGAVVGFAAVLALGRATGDGRAEHPPAAVGALHLLSLAPGFLVVWLGVSHLPPAAAWPLGGLAATALYVLATALALRLVRAPG